MSDPIPPQQPPYTDVPYTDVPNPGGSVPPGGYLPPRPGYPPSAAPSQGLSQNSAAALAYVTIIPSILFLVLEPYNRMPLVRFHAMQNLLLAGVWIVAWFVITLAGIMLHVIPLIGLLFALLHFALFVVIFIAWLMALLKASKGEWFKLPLIGDQAMKLAQNV